MAKLRLTLACWDYDRTRPLKDGVVRPEGVELNVVNAPVQEIFHRMARFREFDVSEFSCSTYTVLRGRGEPFIAIPVFPSRVFRHSAIFVNTGAGIKAPADLRGKRVGVEKYHMTAAVWIRGILEDEYGVAPKDVLWYEGGEGARVKEVDIQLPPAIRLTPVPGDRSLGDMLDKGELDALIGARRPAPFTAGSPRVRRLFPNFREVERAYYQKTGFFPIMHTVMIREELARENAWLPRSLYQAFLEAKRIAYQKLAETGVLAYALPGLMAEAEESRALMGDDPFPYGVEKNRKTLETLTRYTFGQGLAPRQLKMEEMFPESLLDT
jgi:4,5-dihydroxyphthalate decarboxylase